MKPSNTRFHSIMLFTATLAVVLKLRRKRFSGFHYAAVSTAVSSCFSAQPSHFGALCHPGSGDMDT
jgi:hypothetical protein